MTTSWRSYVLADLQRNDHNQAWLSRVTGMGEAHISRLLLGQQAPMMPTLLKIERAMGLKSQTLVRLAVQEEQEKGQAAQGGVS